MAIQQVNNGDSGLDARTKWNNNDTENEQSAANAQSTANAAATAAANAQSTADGRLASVTSDDTLKGLGTAGDPLGVQQLFALRRSDDQSIWRTGQTTEGLVNQTSTLEDYFGQPLQFEQAHWKIILDSLCSLKHNVLSFTALLLSYHGRLTLRSKILFFKLRFLGIKVFLQCLHCQKSLQMLGVQQELL